LITTSPDRLSGTPVFAGTRVPVQTLIDYLEGGDPLEAFLADFPSVSRDHSTSVSSAFSAASRHAARRARSSLPPRLNSRRSSKGTLTRATARGRTGSRAALR